MIKAHFGVPLSRAAERLNVCSTTLKSICRDLGISSWPHGHGQRAPGASARASAGANAASGAAASPGPGGPPGVAGPAAARDVPSLAVAPESRADSAPAHEDAIAGLPLPLDFRLLNMAMAMGHPSGGSGTGSALGIGIDLELFGMDGEGADGAAPSAMPFPF
eukprot:tig00021374_g21088.t1